MVVYNQGSIGSCVANANSLAFLYELRLAKDASIEISGPSRYWLYRKTLQGDQLDGFTSVGELEDAGTWYRHAGRILKNVGDCTEDTCPYVQIPDFDKDTWEEEQAAKKKWFHEYLQKGTDAKSEAEAATHRIKAFYRLDPDRRIDKDEPSTFRSEEEKDAVGVVTLDNLKKCLIESHPVVLAFRFYWEQPPWDKSDPIWSLPEVSPHHAGPDADYGGHAVVAVGYDDEKGEGAVLCQNSWGVDIGDNWKSKGGLFWMPYSWIRNFVATNDFWTLRLQEQPFLTETEVQKKVKEAMVE